LARNHTIGCPPFPGVNIPAMQPLRLLRNLRDERRALGWKGLFRKRGWKLLVLFILFYLVRDLILYIIIPLGTAAWLFR